MELKKRYINKQKSIEYYVENPPFPKIVKIDICDVCNYSCIFCPQAYQSGRIGLINDALCMKIIEESKKGGAEQLALSSTGEPLLNRKLEKYASFAKEIGYTYVFFNTNGFFLDKERGESILKAGVDSVKISINAGADNYYAIHGVDAYEKVIRNLRDFALQKYLMKSNCKIYVSFISTKVTESEIQEVRNIVREYVDDFIYMKANNRGGLVSGFDTKLYGGEDIYSYHYPCSQIFNNVYVTAEGLMDACAQDFDKRLIMGDLNNESVIEAWNGKKFREFRRKYINGELAGTLCVDCLGLSRGKQYSDPKAWCYGYQADEEKKKSLDERIRLLVDKIDKSSTL